MELIDAINKATRVYLIGNGGSAANCIHIANDLISVGIKAHALTADVATLTAIANDFGYEHVFSRQIEVFGEPGDLLLCLTGSGNSMNVIKAIVTAKEKGMAVLCITGAWAVNECHKVGVPVIATGRDMQEAEELQLGFGHDVMLALKKDAS